MEENKKYKFSNGYFIMKIPDYPEGDTTWCLYTTSGKLVGAIRIVDKDLVIEDKYQGSKGNWKSRT